MKKNKPEKVGIIYYWKQGGSTWAMQMVHNTRSSTMDSTDSEAKVKAIAKSMGYKAVKSNG